MDTVPRHIGFIMDGNRRFAKEQGMHPFKGHEAGHKTLEIVLKACRELGVKEVTLFAFSIQNFNRSPEEVEKLMQIFHETAKKIEDDKKKNKAENIRVKFIGRIHMFPKKVQEAIHRAEESTKNNDGFVVNIAMAYGGREEITDAVNALAQEVKKGTLDPNAIDEAMISARLYLNSEPDMIVRTSGEHRLSNFLTWQSIYSEWIFYPKHWPAFSKEDLLTCIKEFNTRERRFGK